MIIPVKCFTCGKVMADKYRYYLEEVQKRKQEGDEHSGDVVYLTKAYSTKSPEAHVMDELGLKRVCCRRHFMTHVDIE